MNLLGLFKKVTEEGYLKVSLNPDYAAVFIICVPTPFKDGYKADLSYVKAAINSILPYIKKDNLIIIESTCPVGTTKKIRDLILNKVLDLNIKENIYLAYCPERVIPGKILYELIYNDRIIGGINEVSSKKAKDFYSLFVQGSLRITDVETVEMCKLTENAFRDVNIAFANEISMICDKLKIDVYELIKLANKHSRVNILKPGCGVGGHCIAVDPWFIVEKTPDLAKLIKTSREVNVYKTEWVIKKKAKEFEEEKLDSISKCNKGASGLKWGVLNPRHFLGRWFKVDSMYRICSSDSLLKSIHFGKYQRIKVSVNTLGVVFFGEKNSSGFG